MPQRLIRSSWWNAHMNVLGLLLLGLGLCSLTVTWYSATAQRRVTDCQAHYNVAFVGALAERNDANIADRRALIDLTNALLKEGGTRMDRYLALERYNTTLRASDVTRDAHPLPAEPACH